MDHEVENLLIDFQKGGAASSEVVSHANDLNLPSDYLNILNEMNGGEGFIGDAYLILWKLDELEEFNRDYETNIYAPGIFLFASDGGGEGFGFDLRTSPYKVVQMPFIGMSLEQATPVADNFIELLKKMVVADGSLL